MREGDGLSIGEVIKKQQPDVYQELIRLSKRKVKKEKIDFKRLMEDAPVYKRHNGAWRQVRDG